MVRLAVYFKRCPLLSCLSSTSFPLLSKNRSRLELKDPESFHCVELRKGAEGNYRVML